MTTLEKLAQLRADMRLQMLEGWGLLPTAPEYRPHHNKMGEFRRQIAELEELARLDEVAELWPNGLPAHP